MNSGSSNGCRELVHTLRAPADAFKVCSAKTHLFTRIHRNSKAREGLLSQLEVGLKPMHQHFGTKERKLVIFCPQIAM